MLKYLLLILSFSLLSKSNAQIDYKYLINKWKVVMIEDPADGEKAAPFEKEQKEFLKFNADSTCESLEEGLLLIRGTWSLDVSANTLTVRQTQSKELAPVVIVKIRKLTPTELVMELLEEDGELNLILYAVPF